LPLACVPWVSSSPGARLQVYLGTKTCIALPEEPYPTESSRLVSRFDIAFRTRLPDPDKQTLMVREESAARWDVVVEPEDIVRVEAVL
jgi:hypothetical protein